MLSKLNNLALGAFVRTQSNIAASADRATTVAPSDRRGRLEIAAGAGLAYCLYLLTVPAFAADKAAQTKVVDLISSFTNFIVLLVAAISVLMGVFAALQFVGSGGSTAVAAKAKGTIKNVIIGLVVCAGIFILKNAIINVVGGAGGTGEDAKGTEFRKTLETGTLGK